MMHKMKMMLQSKKMYHGDYCSLEFSAMYDDSIPEDQRFNKATPSANFVVSVQKDIADQYDLGAYYYFYTEKVA